MHKHLILWPVVGQMALTFFLYIRLLAAKMKAIKDRDVDRRKAALDASQWPDAVVKINNNLRNQFETPVFFFILCVLLWGLDAVDTVAMVLSIVYVVSRCAHAAVHITSNSVKHRGPAFAVGFAALAGLLGQVVRALVALG